MQGDAIRARLAAAVKPHQVDDLAVAKLLQQHGNGQLNHAVGKVLVHILIVNILGEQMLFLPLGQRILTRLLGRCTEFLAQSVLLLTRELDALILGKGNRALDLAFFCLFLRFFLLAGQFLRRNLLGRRIREGTRQVTVHVGDVGSTGIVLLDDHLLALGGQLPVNALERVTHAIITDIADLQAVIRNGRTHRSRHAVRDCLRSRLIQVELSGQHVDLIVILHVHAHAHQTEEVIHVKALDADIVRTAEAEVHLIANVVAGEGCHGKTHGTHGTTHAVCLRQPHLRLHKGICKDGVVIDAEMIFIRLVLFHGCRVRHHVHAQGHFCAEHIKEQHGQKEQQENEQDM